MIQGGGFDEGHASRSRRSAPIKNEATNGLKNDTGTVAMARTGVRDSATAQFFINVKQQRLPQLPQRAQDGWGYAVFGKVVSGMDVVTKIAQDAHRHRRPVPQRRAQAGGRHRVGDAWSERRRSSRLEWRRSSSPTCTSPRSGRQRTSSSSSSSKAGARGAEALYILGDLFEYWIGDDDLDEPFNAVMAGLLRAARRRRRRALLHARQPRLPPRRALLRGGRRRTPARPLPAGNPGSRKRCSRTATRCASTTPTTRAGAAPRARRAGSASSSRSPAPSATAWCTGCAKRARR